MTRKSNEVNHLGIWVVAYEVLVPFLFARLQLPYYINTLLFYHTILLFFYETVMFTKIIPSRLLYC